MPTLHSAQDSFPFMACGLIKSPAPPTLADKIYSRDTSLGVVPLEGYGYFFFATPPYADLTVNEEMVGIKLGQVRAGDELISMSNILNRGLITPLGARHDDIHGNALLLCFSKREPRFCAYKNLLAVPQLYYWVSKEHILCTNNLRLMAEWMDNSQFNPAALPQHFLFRSVTGRQTYLRDVYRLCPGEVLNWHDGTLTVDLCRDLRAFSPESIYQRVEPTAVDQFYEQLRWVMGVYLKEMNANGHRSATLLSGGIDSPMLQLTVNSHLASPPRPLSFSYVLDAPSFAPEIDNAKIASRLLETDHTFVKIPSTAYPDLLVEAIEILGQPPHHEHTPYIYSLTKHISTQEDDVSFLFCGVGADSLHGLTVGGDIYRAEKYRHWPVPLLRLLGTVLDPIWQSKAYGAKRAADLIPYLDDFNSLRNPVNSWYAWTDWGLMDRCFAPSAVREALACRRELETRYCESSNLIEKVHMVILLSNDYDTTALWRQLGLANGEEIIFPYMDDAVLAASLALNPQERFFFNGRTKPILKSALEGRGVPVIANKPKYGSGFADDLPDMMRRGVLRDMVQAIDRPAFMERTDFERKIKQPDWFTMNLLTLDLFNKHVLGRSRWRSSGSTKGSVLVKIGATGEK
jgi:asparagine synthetase B (glutamine-hydrolysing)